MKKIFIPMLFFAAFFPVYLFGQDKADKLDLPGDNLNLYAVLKLFQESETLEGFEQKLNDENSEINNLDLNGDDKTDYIKVIDNTDGDVHTFVLQTDISASEKQDIAVITVQKDEDGKVQVQIIGDEELYGKNYIVEPNADDNVGSTPNPGYTGNKTIAGGKEIPMQQTTTVVVANWPLVRFMYLPTYVTWRSPWYWNYYPSYWHPWRPLYWHAYWGYHSNWFNWYYAYYRRWPVYRYPRWNEFYFNTRRVYSVVVFTRMQNGLYRNTYTRPQTKKDGIALFNKRFPEGNRLPNRPAMQQPVRRPAAKPNRPVTKPIEQRPVTRPVQSPITRPVLKPHRPVARPVQPPLTRPGTRPAQPSNERPLPKDRRGG